MLNGISGRSARAGGGGNRMRKLNIRQGIIGGFVVALISAAAITGHSPDPLPTFASVLTFALACLAVTVGLMVAVNRQPKPPARW